MTFEAQELSLDSGQPAFLFAFSREGRSWYYNNSAKDITYETNVYLAVPIVDGGITQEGGAEADEYKLSMPASTAFCQYLDAVNTSFSVSLVVRKVHLVVDSGLSGEYAEPLAATAKLIWAGNLQTVGRPAQNVREITCVTQVSSMKRGGLRLGWGRSCPHMLYGRGCLVNKASFATTLATPVVVDGVTISSVSADALADGWFSGGYVEWQYEAGLIERTAIESHVGETLTLLGTTQGMQHAITGAYGPFVAYAGCNRTAQECETKFNNKLNFGGIEYLQGKNPFAGDPIF